ncbi:MAG: DUF1841 family protein [Pseudomonadota bacterium]
MIFGQDRNQMRRVFFESWRKYRNGLPLEPLEDAIASAIREHPEYHAILEDEEISLHKDYLPEMGQANPFLHLAMHLAIREQITTDRPAGIRGMRQQLLNRLHDPHEVEHQMAECLAEIIWQAQRNQTAPDEIAYLDCLQKKM